MGRQHCGFALVELLVVVAVVSLLAALTINAARARQNVQDTQIQTELKAIYAEITMFQVVNNRDPVSWAELVPSYVNLPNVEGKYDFVVN